jgi:SAM-dependent methyltransferase
LTAVDTAEGMIKALRTKLAAQTDASNINPVCAVLEDPDDPKIQDTDSAEPPKRFDLVISHLVLHHIPSLLDILKTMWGTLKTGGCVALTDFENFGPEAMQFHPQQKLEGVERHGITKQEMESLLKQARFINVEVKEAWRMPKETERGGSLDFPFLICMGSKAN